MNDRAAHATPALWMYTSIDTVDIRASCKAPEAMEMTMSETC